MPQQVHTHLGQNQAEQVLTSPNNWRVPACVIDLSPVAPNPVTRIRLDKQGVACVAKLPLGALILGKFGQIAAIDNVDFPLIPQVLVKAPNLLPQAFLHRRINLGRNLLRHAMVAKQQRLRVHHPLFGRYKLPSFQLKGCVVPLAKNPFYKRREFQIARGIRQTAFTQRRYRLRFFSAHEKTIDDKVNVRKRIVPGRSAFLPAKRNNRLQRCDLTQRRPQITNASSKGIAKGDGTLPAGGTFTLKTAQREPSPKR